MSYPLPVIDLATAAPTDPPKTVDWQQISVQSARPGNTGPHLMLYNESGCGLQITFNTTEGIVLPAGGWIAHELNPNCTSFTYTVLYVLPNAPVTKLIIVYYEPYEEVPSVPILGNSPVGIGGSVSTTSIQTLTNDGNPANTQIIEAKQSGSSGSNVSIDNSGNEIIREWTGSVLNTIRQTIANAVAGTDVIILGKVGNFFTHILGKLTVDGAANFHADPVTLDATAAGIEQGNPSVANTPHIDFHSSGGSARDFDSRLIASGGSTTVDGQGTLQIAAALLSVLAQIQSNVNVMVNPSGVGATTPTMLDVNPSGGTVTKRWSSPLYNGGNGHIQFFNITDSVNVLDLNPNGNIAIAGIASITGNATINGGNQVMQGKSAGGGNNGSSIFEGTIDPAGSAAEGDIWLNG
jgi:hypothetical protein